MCMRYESMIEPLDTFNLVVMDTKKDIDSALEAAIERAERIYGPSVRVCIDDITSTEHSDVVRCHFSVYANGDQYLPTGFDVA